MDDSIHYVAVHGFSPDFLDYMRSLHLKVDRGSVTGRAVLERGIIHVHDVLADLEFALLGSQKLGGFRTALGVPLMREGTPIGAMFLARSEVDPFTQQQIDLVATFRGAKIDYIIFGDSVIVVAAAWLFGNMPELTAHRLAFPIGVTLLATQLVFGQAQAIRTSFLLRRSPERTCEWVSHYVKLIERFPYCPPKT